MKQEQMNIKDYMQAVGRRARAASRDMARASTNAKDRALMAMASAIRRDKAALLAANREDLDAARAAGLDDAMLDRLALFDKSVATMAEGLEQIAALADPIGEMTDLKFRPSGIQVGRMRVPLGVIGIIYEARPNVTVDAAGLCLKAGNAVILRGGSEALHSNRALAESIRLALAEAGLPEAAVQVVPVTDREAVTHLLSLEEYIDLIIPRGGEGLIRFVVQHSAIPVLKHYKGVCHVYVDEDADLAGSGGAAADLYAGVGLFSTLVAGRFERVVAVESSARSLAFAARNAAPAALEAYPMTVEQWIAAGAAGGPFDAVIVDPRTRTGWVQLHNTGVEPTEVTIERDGQSVTLTGEALARWKYQRYMQDYLACVQSVDDNLGRLLDVLKESGLEETTIVVYTSDQGFFLGDHGMYDKRFMYEESLRMPLLVRWPAAVRPGTQAEAMALNVDFAPTFLEAAGAAVPDSMQGRSLLPLLRGETPADWRTAIYYRYYHDPGHHDTRAHLGVRTATHKLIHFWKKDQWELFDLRADPAELRNLYGRPGQEAVTGELKATLARLRAELQDDDRFADEQPPPGVDGTVAQLRGK